MFATCIYIFYIQQYYYNDIILRQLKKKKNVKVAGFQQSIYKLGWRFGSKWVNFTGAFFKLG